MQNPLHTHAAGLIRQNSIASLTETSTQNEERQIPHDVHCPKNIHPNIYIVPE